MVGCIDGTRVVRILIADDNEALRKSLYSAFEPMGFTVYLAPGGATAVTVARKRPIDIAILDVNMPDLDGIEAMRRIKKIRSLVNGIFITSEVSGSVRRRVVATGACTIVRKPIRIEKLRCAVLDILSRQGIVRGGDLSEGGPHPCNCADIADKVET